MSTRRSKGSAQTGLTFVELIMFIVIVGVGLAGILAVLNVTVKSSADPLINKQMLAIAEALMEEVAMMPFTYCDPTDADAASATSATVGPGGCAATVENLGPDVGEARTNAANPFNNVNDYAGLALASPIGDISGTAAAPAGYSAAIAIANDGNLGVVGAELPSSEVLRITVTVTHGSDSIALEGYRTRYAPNNLP
ncbi:MAG: type II secretion system protein [Betaproteobacteria bacterium]|nr:type II secretion system protein [Betaproteobacteria bacterium]